MRGGWGEVGLRNDRAMEGMNDRPKAGDYQPEPGHIAVLPTRGAEHMSTQQ